jgi:hypothetical protein
MPNDATMTCCGLGCHSAININHKPMLELIAELLSLPNEATNLNLSPQRKRERLFEALLNEMEALSRRRPVLAMFEDAYVIDDLLALLILPISKS